MSRTTKERPVAVALDPAAWGSDAIAELLRELGIEHVTLNPGSSYRGLHDSLVNHLGNEAPQLLLCLHEEHAVAIAHGFAKVTDRAMAVALHSNVGLMHASMAIFNAYCDRVPILLIGATGPLDAARRRPWIDWLHTATDQAALVRPFVKWDDQPLSVPAALDALMQAHMLTSSVPRAPTYVCLDASLQEAPLAEEPARPASARFAPAAAPQPPEEAVARVAELLRRAERPIVLAGRTSRSTTAWHERIDLVERLGARVFTHLKLPAAFPTTHPLYAAPAQVFPSAALREALLDADAILALDWLDLGGTLGSVGHVEGPTIAVSLDHQLHSGWGKESFTPAPVDVRLDADVDATVAALLRHVPARVAAPSNGGRAAPTTQPPVPAAPGPLTVADVAAALRVAVADVPVSLVRVPHGWGGELWDVAHPLDFLGADGGEGVGSGIGMAIGAALALRATDRIAVAVLGDGDYLMGVNGLWTAAHYELGALIVVANNRSFFNDEIHQHRVAVRRDRPVENAWIGQRIDDPEPSLVQLAAAQGVAGFGPVDNRSALADALTVALEHVRAGAPAVIDVHIESSVASETARAATQTERG